MSRETTKLCFHCGEMIPQKTDWSVSWHDKNYATCCPGCKSVMEMIIENGLEEFYQKRDALSVKSDPLSRQEIEKISTYNQPKIAQEYIQHNDKKHEKLVSFNLFIEDISCSACIWLIEKKVSDLSFVDSISINAVNKVATINVQDYRDEENSTHLGDVLKTMRQYGYHPSPLRPQQLAQSHQERQKDLLKRLGVAGLGMMQVMMFAAGLYAGSFQGMELKYQLLLRWVSMVVATPVVLYSASPFFKKAWGSLKSKQMGMDIPVAIAIASAYILSVYHTLIFSGEVYFDSAVMFTFFLLIGRYLQSQASWRALESSLITEPTINPLIQKKCLGQSDQSTWQYVSINTLQLKDIVLVPAGATIPVDGVILQGTSEVELSVINGEVEPHLVAKDDKVLAGCLNHTQPLEVSCESLGKDRFIDKIAKIQYQTLSQKSSTQSIADQYAQIFILFVLSAALFTLVYWLKTNPHIAFSTTLSVLIITCPCALSLATPAAITAAMSQAKKFAVLITNPDAIEKFNQISWIVFDKTGTLTTGEMHIKDSINMDPAQELTHWQSIASALEQGFEHPIASAFTHHYNASKLKVLNRKNVVGQGVQAEINGNCYHLGNFPEFASPQLKELIQSHQKNHLRSICLYQSKQPKALFILHDPVRESGLDLIKSLKLKHKKIAILTGDPSANAEDIKTWFQVDEVLSGLTPSEKSHWVEQKQSQHKVLMIGDGLNDAPVLSQADISIAMSDAVALSKSGSDMILLNDNLKMVENLFLLATKTRNIINQNLSWAVIYNLLTIPLAMMGKVEPWIAAAGMSLSSIFVVLNALRLNRNL